MHPIGLKKSKLTDEDRHLMSRMTIFLYWSFLHRFPTPPGCGNGCRSGQLEVRPGETS